MADASTPNARSAVVRATGRGTRAWIALQVFLALLLAGAAVVLVTWLAERTGLRARFDLTASRMNTLSPETRSAIESLTEPIDIDVFFRPGEGAIAPLIEDVQIRTNRLLVLLRDGAPGRIRVHEHDLLDPMSGQTRAQARLRELGIAEVGPGGVLALSRNVRKVVLRTRGDLADIDPGNTGARGAPPMPARVVSYRGEEALVSAIVKVVEGDSPKVIFTTGHGERVLDDPDEAGLTRLRSELESDGFEIETWAGESAGPLPKDASVVAILGPEQPFTSFERGELATFLESGGALVVAPGANPLTGEGSLVALVEPYGVRISTSGVIARPIATVTGRLATGQPECERIVVTGQGFSAQPLTDALRRAGRRVLLSGSRALEIGPAPPGGVVLPLLRSSDDAWRDLPQAGSGRTGLGNWTPDAGEDRGPFVLALLAKFSPLRPPPEGRPSREGLRLESRLYAFGTAKAFANADFDYDRDLVLNLFNEAASREFRVNVVRKSAETHRIDLTSGTALGRIHIVSAVLLPLACLACGLFLAWRRRR